MSQLTLSEIFIYPIKSLGGISLHKASVLPKGLQHDRRWMLIDNGGVAMTQRDYPEMALFKVSLREADISVDYAKGEKVLSSTGFNISDATSNMGIRANVWGDLVEVVEIHPQVSKWFSHHLGTTCRLVAFPENNPRPVDPRYRVGNDHVSLADAYPFLLIGRSSLDDLNKRLAAPVPMNRFRPNFVFTGGDAFEEDHWTNLLIGNVPFRAVKKSARCTLITVDQDTGQKGAEPLRTLSTFRKTNNKVFFGQNLVALEVGEVALGDLLIPG